MIWNDILIGIYLHFLGFCYADSEAENAKVEEDVGKSRDGSRTDDEVVAREEEAIKFDGMNVAEVKEMRDRAEKFAYKAEVNRMMKLIINSLYKNKEVSFCCCCKS